MVRTNYIKDSGTIKIGKQLYKNVKYEDVKFINVIGAGSFGTVSKCALFGNAIAVKVIPTCDQEDEKLCKDLEALKCTDCSNIVTFYGYIITRDQIIICMERMAMCLDKLYKKYIKPYNFKIPECILGKITVYVIEALKDLKDIYNMIHGDIKPSNILINWDGSIKLCDFGISGMLVDSCPNTPLLGSLAYCSPERLSSLKYGSRADIWSLGITLIELAMCKHPYENLDHMELEIRVRFDPSPNTPFFYPSPKLYDNFSLDFEAFVDSCLQKDVLRRPKYKDLVNFKWYQTNKSDVTDLSFWLENVLKQRKEILLQQHITGNDSML